MSGKILSHPGKGQDWRVLIGGGDRTPPPELFNLECILIIFYEVFKTLSENDWFSMLLY